MHAWSNAAMATSTARPARPARFSPTGSTRSIATAPERARFAARRSIAATATSTRPRARTARSRSNGLIPPPATARLPPRSGCNASTPAAATVTSTAPRARPATSSAAATRQAATAPPRGPRFSARSLRAETVISTPPSMRPATTKTRRLATGAARRRARSRPASSVRRPASLATRPAATGRRWGTRLCDDFNSNACGTCSATCTGAQPAKPATGSITAVSRSEPGQRRDLHAFGRQPQPQHCRRSSSTATRRPIPRTSRSARETAGHEGMATKIASAINGVGAGLAINAIVNSNNHSQVLLTNGNPGSAGNVKVTETVANTDFVVVGMSGGAGFDCPAATGCGGNDDCQSGVCCLGTPGTTACPCPTSGGTCASFVQNTCLASSCNDSDINGTETDVDCGGSGCPPSAQPGKPALSPATVRRASVRRASALRRAAPTKSRTGTETAVDCGGGLSCVRRRRFNCISPQRLRGRQHLQSSRKCVSTCSDGLPRTVTRPRRIVAVGSVRPAPMVWRARSTATAAPAALAPGSSAHPSAPTGSRTARRPTRTVAAAPARRAAMAWRARSAATAGRAAFASH